MLKKTPYIILVFFLFSGQVPAQDIRAAARELQKSQVLSKEGKKAFERFMAGTPVPQFGAGAGEGAGLPAESGTEPAMLDFFVTAEFLLNGPGYGAGHTEVPGQDCRAFMGPLWSGLQELDDLDPFEEADRSLMDRRLRLLAYPLHQAGVIDPRMYQDLIRRLEEGYVLPASSFFQYLQSRKIFYEGYAEKKASQLTFLRQLEYAGLLTPEENDRLQNSYRPFELKNALDILDHCGKALVLDAQGLPREPAAAYAFILQRLQARLLPDFDFRLQAPRQTLARDEDGEPYETEIIEVWVRERNYQQILSFDPSNFDTDPFGSPFSFSLVSDWDFKMLNDYLADAGSTQRLYVLTDQPLLPYEAIGSRLGFVLMDSNQVEVWNQSYSLPVLTLSPPSPAYKEISAVIKTFEGLGMVSPLRSGQRDSLLVEIRRDGHASPRSILASLPGAVATISWYQVINPDAEDSTFQRVVHRLRAVSRGGFEPGEVWDNLGEVLEERDTVFRYGFSLDGKTFERSVRLDYAYQALDIDFVPLVNEALQACGRDGRFVPLQGAEGSRVLYLSPAQLQGLQEHFPGLVEGE